MLLTTSTIKKLSIPQLENCASELVYRQSFINPKREIYKVMSLLLGAIREEIEKRQLDAMPTELALIRMHVPFVRHADTFFITE